MAKWDSQFLSLFQVVPHGHRAQRTATLALRGSLESLERLQRLIGAVPPAQSAAFLPAFFANLDVDGIPTPSEMDTGAPLVRRHPVNCAGASMYSIYRLHRIPTGAFSELWPRLWKWLQFYYTYCHFFVAAEKERDGRSRIDAGTICQDFVKFVGSFHKSKAIVDLMLGTPGFRYIVARAWVCRLDDTQEQNLSAVYPDVSRLIMETGANMQPAHIQELIDAAGGHYTDLAALLIRYIRAILPTRDSPSPITMDLLGCVVEFLPHADEAFDGGELNSSPGLLGEALLERGIVGTFTSVLYAVSDVFAPGGDTVLEDCAAWLIETLSDPRLHSLITEALDAGLLFSVASCIADGVITEHVTTMLETVLPWAITYHRNVKRLHKIFLQAKPVLETEEFQNSELAPLWRVFATLAQDRAAVLQAYATGARSDRRACDSIKVNLVCAWIPEAYLSNHTVRTDPQKRGVPAFLTSHTGEHQRDLTARERPFLRAVLLHDYEQGQWSTIAAQHLSFMATHPGEAFFTLFDYRRGRVKISVHPVAGFAGEGSKSPTASAEWKNDVARAAQSGGQLEIHVMLIPEGSHSRYLLVPLRSSSQRKHKMLKRLASLGLKPRDIPEMIRGVQISSIASEIFCY
ncbi:hypothetical protein DFH06DRAFT_1296101 [Mycena polygramma]|nr:hypothetical protein DFH06DRAFT_1296101 [Mycena polygramma]